MNEKVLKTLEFYKITDQIKEYAGSEPGKAMCDKLRPSSNLEWIREALEETDAALLRLVKNDRISFSSNSDIRATIKEAKIGQTLSARELLSIARLLTLTSELSTYGEKPDEDTPDDALSKYFDRLYTLPLLEKEIKRCIISDDEIADDASSTLSSIRKSYGVIGNRIHTHLTNMVNGSARSYLQDPVITMRNNRYCLPVKAEYKSQVPGMVHDQSSTGSTLFIEPATVVSLNNKLKELELQERDEIARILSDLSSKVSIHGDSLLENQKTITLLDFIFAKGKYALSLNATKPIFNEEHRINLRSARHPLLDQKKAVPISISLGENFDLLIITGPNTGGKTVSLKTVGLLTLMGQSGLMIPTLDRSELGLFKEVYADIGDEQSIEQSLSTFSSHMTSIVDILQKANADTLCLFDELGAGTDPSEGAALAISILDYLHDRGIRTMATTHYSELKIYALQTSFVENGCCEFDVESLRPTYRLLLGIPGKSNAFAISKKLGLPDEIIEHAKETLSNEQESFENVISDLENKRIIIEKEKQEIENYKSQIARLEKELSEKQEQMDAKRQKILNDAKEEARDILKEAKQIADDSIRAFNNPGSTMSIQTMEKKRSNLRNQIKKNEAVKASETDNSNIKTISLKDAVPGTSVHIISMNIDGTITVRPDSGGNVSVQCGIITSKVNIRDLVEIKPEAKKTATIKRQAKLDLSKTSNMSTEINVIGMTVDEAVSVVDKFIDDAFLCHASTVRIVHGKGTGALRNGIHSYLRSCKHVASFSLAAHGQGDAGVTVVNL